MTQAINKHIRVQGKKKVQTDSRNKHVDPIVIPELVCCCLRWSGYEIEIGSWSLLLPYR